MTRFVIRSAFNLITDIQPFSCDVRFVPLTDTGWLSPLMATLPIETGYMPNTKTI
jgi:hypothetical protein